MKTIVAALLLCPFAVHAQAPPEFEVASVRLANPQSEEAFRQAYLPTLNVEPGTNLRIANLKLRDIILLAYGIGARQLVGPEWLVNDPINPGDIERFDVIAKVPATASKAQVPLMLQKLVADRFKLAMHKDVKSIQVYALSVDKGGLKIQPEAEGDRRAPGCRRVVASEANKRLSSAVCQSMTMAQFASQLATLAPAYFREGPVVDRTGLTPAYDFTVEWMTLQQLDAGETGPTMFEGVKKLGLNLDKQKDNAEVFVIDRVEKMPTEN